MKTRLIIVTLALLSITNSYAMTELQIEDVGVIDSRLNDTAALADFARLGTDLMTADVNGDGTTDLIVSSPGSSSARGIAKAGRVYIFFGGSTVQGLARLVNLPDDGAADVTLSGTEEFERIGELMHSGDLNGDNITDLVIVAQRNTSVNDGRDETRIYIVFGRQNFDAQMELKPDADVTLQRAGLPDASGGNSRFVFHVCGLAVGDLNGDKIDDLAICDDENKVIQVVYGQSTWPAEIALETDVNVQIGSDGGDLFTTVGVSKKQGMLLEDLNGDGIDDLTLGLKEYDLSSSLEDVGGIFVFYGKSGFPAAPSLADADIVLTGALNRDQMGGTLAVGDIDGDGKKDLIIGAPESSKGVSGVTGAGRVQVVKSIATRGNSFDLFSDADVTLAMSSALENTGFKTGDALLVHDMNGDGMDDIIIGTPNAFIKAPPGGTNGWVNVVYGKSDLSGNIMLDTDADFFILAPLPTSTLAGGRFGAALAAGDIDGDGNMDLIASAPLGTSLKPEGGFGIAGGWVALLNNLQAKGMGVAGTLSLDGLLSLPILSGVPNSEALSISMQFNFNTGLFDVVDLALSNATGVSFSSYDPDTGAIDIPVLSVPDIGLFAVKLGVVSVSPLQFGILAVEAK